MQINLLDRYVFDKVNNLHTIETLEGEINKRFLSDPKLGYSLGSENGRTYLKIQASTLTSLFLKYKQLGIQSAS